MAVNSKMAPRSSARRSKTLLTGASACALGAFSGAFNPSQNFAVAPGPALRTAQLPSTTSAMETSAASEKFAKGITAQNFVMGGALGAFGAMAATKGKPSKGMRAAKVHSKISMQAKSPDNDKGGIHAFAAMASEFIARPDTVSTALIRRISASAQDVLRDGQERCHLATKELQEVVAGAEIAASASFPQQQRWVANTLATTLMTFAFALQPANAADQVTYSDFLASVNKGDVEMVRVQSDLLTAQYTSKDGSRHEVNLVPNSDVDDSLFTTLTSKKVDVVMQNGQQDAGPFDFLARFAGPIAWLIAGLLLFFGGAGQGGGMGAGGNPFQLGQAKAKIAKEGDIKTKFADVAGCDGAKEELVEVVDFLKNSSRYSELGAKIPKGALLVGPPGTGKTLLAKAVAGEAGVPFFSISASEFVEVFAGIGASRVRDLFAQAKKSAPCIIFIDEIDAVGRQRSAGFGQGNDEREQTVNQLLTEMDGFEANNGVVVLAATNRADILDAALMRPGRFDRKIQVDPPDVEGRTAILKVHAKGKTLAPGVDLGAIARQTPGMSGADLANLLNEGAIFAARQNKTEVDQDDIANALERIAIGLERKDAVMTKKKQELVAYHESGHAILGALMNDYDVVAKISIVPRGPAGGVTIFMPSEERLDTGLYSKEFLENRMCVALGGRIAEELINGIDNVTTGASNDFQQCTQVAQAMVTQLGMSPVVGQRAIGQQQGGNPFMGRDMNGGGSPPTSQSLKSAIDAEVKRVVDEQYKRGKYLLENNRYLLDKLAAQLMDQEKMSGEELMKMVNGIAAEGKLVMTVPDDVPEMAAAAYVGESAITADAQASTTDDDVRSDEPLRRLLKSTTDDDDFVAAAALVSKRAQPKRAVEDRLGLEVASSRKTTGQLVQEQVKSLATEASSQALPANLVNSVSAQVLATLAATAVPLPAVADGEMPQAPQMQMQQQAQQVTGRATYSRMLQFVEEGAVKRVDFYDFGRTAVVQASIGGREQQLSVDTPGATSGLIAKLQEKGVAIEVHTPDKPNPLVSVVSDIAFPLLIVGGLLFFRSQGGQGAGGMPGNPMQSKAKIQVQPETGVKFEDVAGIEEAKQELTEIVDFLKNPQRFTKVGAKIPKGVLLTGPPGTGKTLMAKALAGESGVPFIQSSASEFIEMFVGVGASRVRDIFKQAKEKAPCIVFIDEIDAIGRQRGAGMGGGNDEREQTLNQILTEMDGFEGNTGVIVVAATNRSDILDNALLRPGRFDRRVQVDLPDVKGREQILQVHIKNKKLDSAIGLKEVAQRTAGMSGADLENLMNESAILAARRNKQAISLQEIQDATDRVIAGLEGRALSDNASKRLIAYHEAGHALVGTLLPYHDPVNKVSLVPRGQAKGLTWFTPSEDQSLISKNNLRARITGALGGRAAEQVVFGMDKVTSGASGDLQQVERMARAMVTQLGMSKVGTIAIDDGGYMGPSYSEELGANIDEAIHTISDECYLTALTLLTSHRACLDRITDELMEVETLSGDRLRELVSEYVEIPEKEAVI